MTAVVLCTIHFHPLLQKNHTSASSPGDTDWNRNAGTCLSEISEVCPRAEMASDWNMVSNQQRFIDQSKDQWRDCFIACLSAKLTRYNIPLGWYSFWLPGSQWNMRIFNYHISHLSACKQTLPSSDSDTYYLIRQRVFDCNYLSCRIDHIYSSSDMNKYKI